jgi:hypothetical protein
MASLQDHVETLDRYLEGYEPGSCTRACLAMDLEGAVRNADPTTRYILADIASHIINRLPRESWGSYERVDAWLKAKRAERAR